MMVGLGHQLSCSSLQVGLVAHVSRTRIHENSVVKAIFRIRTQVVMAWTRQDLSCLLGLSRLCLLGHRSSLGAVCQSPVPDLYWWGRGWWEDACHVSRTRAFCYECFGFSSCRKTLVLWLRPAHNLLLRRRPIRIDAWHPAALDSVELLGSRCGGRGAFVAFQEGVGFGQRGEGLVYSHVSDMTSNFGTLTTLALVVRNVQMAPLKPVISSLQSAQLW